MDYIYINKLQFCGDAPWHVRTGWDYGWVFMIIGIFCVGTMCTSSQYLMEYCDSGMGFLLQWDLIIWIFVGTRHGTSLQGGILDGVYDNWYFLWDDVHIVPIFDGIL